ncbi:hypothetical protein AGMMS50212_09250 [Spirochaetia bacterium]|nr:hypothetical protein AGMMS50212_09200 [Spirochaetia bacterium]GHV83585.1 hypothetical protein AGMMS50212_09250 [Spirochaetia bacterium]
MPIPWDEADPKEKEPPSWEPRLSSIELTADGSPILPNETFDTETFLYNVNLNGGSYGTLEIDAVPENTEDTVSIFVDGEPSTTINNPQPGNFFVVEVSNGYKSTTYIVAVTSGTPGTARLNLLKANGSTIGSIDRKGAIPLVIYTDITAAAPDPVTFSWTVSDNTRDVESSTNSGNTWMPDFGGSATTLTVAPNQSKILLIKLTSTDGAHTTYYINVRREAAAAGNLLLSLTVGGSSVAIDYTMQPTYAEIGYPAGTFDITAGFTSGGTVKYSGAGTGAATVGGSGTTSTITCGTLTAGVSKTILITVTANGTSKTHGLIL